MSLWIQIISLGALTGTALIAGLLYAFSVCVMKALSNRPDAEGIRAMQEINRVILNPVFLLSFTGSALLAITILVSALIGWGAVPSLTILAAILYLVGGFAITAAGNVPMNNKLDAVEPDKDTSYWRVYLKKWMALNHLRTIACTLSVLCYGIGFLQS